MRSDEFDKWAKLLRNSGYFVIESVEAEKIKEEAERDSLYKRDFKNTYRAINDAELIFIVINKTDKEVHISPELYAKINYGVVRQFSGYNYCQVLISRDPGNIGDIPKWFRIGWVDTPEKFRELMLSDRTEPPSYLNCANF